MPKRALSTSPRVAPNAEKRTRQSATQCEITAEISSKASHTNRYKYYRTANNAVLFCGCAYAHLRINDFVPLLTIMRCFGIM